MCLSLLLIDYADFYGENLLQGTKMEPCPENHQGTDISITDWLTFPSLSRSLPLHSQKATLVPEEPLPRLSCWKDTSTGMSEGYRSQWCQIKATCESLNS